MEKATIKEEFKTTVIGFGNSGLPLGERDDLNDLALIAHESQDPSLLNLFDNLPAHDELKKARVDADLAKSKVVPLPQAEIPKDAVVSPKNPTIVHPQPNQPTVNMDPNKENKNLPNKTGE